jgi:hypothetical protein
VQPPVEPPRALRPPRFPSLREQLSRDCSGILGINGEQASASGFAEPSMQAGLVALRRAAEPSSTRTTTIRASSAYTPPRTCISTLASL